MFSVVTNIYNKKTKGPTLMGLFTATGILHAYRHTTASFLTRRFQPTLRRRIHPLDRPRTQLLDLMH